MRCNVYKLIITLLFILPTIGHAQLGMLTPGSNASLNVSPQMPEPGSVVTVSVNDFSIPGSATNIVWRVNDVVRTNQTNKRSIQVTAGDIGETVTVAATITMSRGQTITLDTAITASRLTLIVEPFTTAPSWYKGRSLPSVGSRVRVVAIPQTGDATAPEDYLYNWKFNNAVQDSGAVRGQFSNVFTMPFGQEAVLTVDVSNTEGTVVARRSIVIPNQEPEVYFYPLNLLRGIGDVALTPTTPLLGSETTIRAETFHMGKDAGGQDLNYEWRVNGRTVQNPNQDQQTITLQNGGGSGEFRVDFRVRNTRDLVQSAQNSINVVF